MVTRKVFDSFTQRWSCEGGYRQVLFIAVPLILSTGAWSVQHFVDRIGYGAEIFDPVRILQLKSIGIGMIYVVMQLC